MYRKTHTRSLAMLGTLTTATLLSACGGDAQTRQNGPRAEADAPASDATPARLSTSNEPVEASVVTLHVSGLSCPLCATNIDKQIERLPGVRSAFTDLSRGTVEVQLADSGRPSTAQLARAVEDSGFTLTRIQIR
jgi:copper chaperone CopZ